MDTYSKTAFRFAIIAAFGGFIFGLDAALISGTVRYITQDFSLNDIQLGSVVSAPGLGVIFALIATGPICDRIGRKKTLLVIASIYLVSAIFSMIAPTYETLVAARFLGGLSFTSLSLASMYIGEIAPPRMRGKLVAMNQIAIVVGLTSAYFSNYFLIKFIPQDTFAGISIWRIMLGVEILPAFAWLLLVLTIPESPRWLIVKGYMAEAENVMSKLIPPENVDLAIKEIKNSLMVSQGDTKTLWLQLSDLFHPSVRTALIIGVVFAIVQPITGINAILFYAPMVFEQTGVGTDAAFLQTLMIGLVSFIFTVLALLLIDKLGRRPLVIFGLISSTFCLFTCFFAFSNATYRLDIEDIKPLVSMSGLAAQSFDGLISATFNSDIEFKTALINNLGDDIARRYESQFIQAAININIFAVMFGILGFIAAFQFSIGPVMWVVFSEIVPMHVRGIAIPFFACISSTLSFFVQQFFPWQLNNLGAAEIFLFYAIAGLIGLFLLSIFLPETKNKSLEEIEKMLIKSKKVDGEIESIS